MAKGGGQKPPTTPSGKLLEANGNRLRIRATPLDRRNRMEAVPEVWRAARHLSEYIAACRCWYARRILITRGGKIMANRMMRWLSTSTCHILCVGIPRCAQMLALWMDDHVARRCGKDGGLAQ